VLFNARINGIPNHHKIKEQAMSDIELRSNVLEELEFEPSIDAADIGVAVEKGVVTLTGHVPSFWQKTTAERAVWRVKGVKAIAQEIAVRYPNDKKVADDQIAERALNMLAWDAAVPQDSVRIKVQNGWVTLEGEVNWQYQRVAAETDMRKLSSVVGVSNNITIKSRAQAPNIRKRIEDALKRNAEVEAEQISIDIRDNGVVRLEGQVDSWDELQAIKTAAWSAPGVRMVDDRITIV
jgi:osmotically-inducible protein OsmY